jgi:hypothetical protein
MLLIIMTLALFVHVIGWKIAHEIRMQISVDISYAGLCAYVEHGESRLVIDSTESGINEKMCGT